MGAYAKWLANAGVDNVVAFPAVGDLAHNFTVGINGEKSALRRSFFMPDKRRQRSWA
jgi:hypothetical protein